MVRRLQHPTPGRRKRAGQRGFDLCADVTRKDDRDITIANLEHDRVVVANDWPFPIGQRRMHGSDLDLTKLDRIARLYSSSATADPRRANPNVVEELGGWRRHAFPDFTRSEIGHHRGGAANVVRMSVGQHEVVETLHSLRPEKRRHHSLAHDGCFTRTGAATGVNQQ